MPTAESVNCVSAEPAGAGPQVAALQMTPSVPPGHEPLAGETPAAIPVPVNYQKFTSQDDLGHFLVQHYKIRAPRELTSCEVCHR